MNALKVNSKIIFILSLLVLFFYFTSLVLFSDVYKYAVVGALFELFSIPMLLLLVVLPVLCLIQLMKATGARRGYVIASLMLIVTTIVLIVRTG
jgi:hypothetical protein